MTRLWIAFGLVIAASFAVLGWIGSRIYQEAPPIPDRVVNAAGAEVMSAGSITRGQNVWQAMGGMEVGSIWGHGSYVAPDWTADYLHREAVFILNQWSQREFQADFESLSPERKGALEARLASEMHRNDYDPATNTLSISADRSAAFRANLEHYSDVFTNGRAAYAIPKGAQPDPEKLRDLASFFFWTSWSAAARRERDNVSYTQNWPHEPLIGNHPTGETIVWTGVSVIMLLGGICALVWYYASREGHGGADEPPMADPLLDWRPTPSQRATLKYFWIVAALILVQITLGVVTAHYGVEGDGFYGIPLSQWLPYAVTRTWHVQLAVLWIATAWLGAGLFIAPLISGSDPAFQRAGVNLLFVALVAVVGGSLAGQWLSIANLLSPAQSFYLGHQGYEYVDLGRVWQIALLVGLFLWLALMLRATLPAFRQPGEHKHLLAIFLVSTTAIAGFYGAGLMWGQQTHLSVVEYWRWWVVHLWVEGFFEVFATTVIAFFFFRLGMIRPLLAAQASLLSATIYLAGGIIGTCHHLYWSGTPTVALAWGSVFSALEVVPLTLVAYSALEDLRVSRRAPWLAQYKWPIYFFVAVAFWNMVGAGLFGFMINPPIALYYMQGLNTTPVHGHAALFGVYGMLGIGLMLVCLRAYYPGRVWKDGTIGFAFWGMNVGLFAMCVLSLLPVGLMQTWAAVDTGYWYARSSDFLQTPVMSTLRWLRVPGDTLFALGAIALVLFIAGLPLGYSFRPDPSRESP